MRTLVRCLGPKKREHYFLSDDPAYNRLCKDCTRRLSAMNIGPLYQHRYPMRPEQ